MLPAKLFVGQCLLGKPLHRYNSDVNNIKYRLLRSARWRKTLATDKQKALVSKRWLKRDTLDDAASENMRSIKLATMTKGEAANIIVRLKHGAQVASFIHLPFHHILSLQNSLVSRRK